MSSLRPLVTPQIPATAAKASGKPPKLEYLSLSRLRVDDSYQRRVEGRGLKAIARICGEFDWNRFAPLVVARVPETDTYAIIDGQHRATAALLRGFDTVPCAIVEASEKEQPAIFTAINGMTTPITIFQLFKAGRAAAEEWALDIDRACAVGGIIPLVYPKARREIRPFETMAIGTLRQNVARFGVKDVGEALRHAAKHPGAAEPGYWASRAINVAVAEWRIMHGKRQEGAEPAISLTQRIRELRKKGYSRFAIQAALRVSLAEIEAAIMEAA